MKLFAVFIFIAVFANSIPINVTCGNTNDGTNINTENDDDDKVKVELFYEVFDSGCRKFYPAFRDVVLKLAHHIKVITYPAGVIQLYAHENCLKSVCENGDGECYGNSLHACSTDVLKNVTQSVTFNNCMMSQDRAVNGSDDAAADFCGKLYHIDTEAIKSCAKSGDGKQLLLFNAVFSYKHHANFTLPLVSVNGKTVKSNNETLLGDICKAFKHPPQPCSSNHFSME